MPEETRQDIFSDDEIDLFELAGILWKRKKIIIALTFSLTLITIIISFLITPVYKSTAKIIPITSGREINIPIPGELMGMLGLTGRLGGSSENIIKAVLESRELAKMVIQELDLRRYIFPDVWDEKTGRLKKDISDVPTDDEIAEKFLRDFIEISSDKKTGVIEISVLFPKSPTLAAIVANKIIDALQVVLNQKAYTTAKKHRIFLEEQAKIAKNNLERAEREFAEFQSKYNVVAIDKQMEESIKLYAELVGMLSEKEVKLGVLKKLTSPDNPEVISLEYEINEIKKKLRELEEGQKTQKVKGYILDTAKRVIIPLENVPELAMEYIRKRRELEIQNEIYKVILTALEKAKIDEAKEDIAFQVIDYAYPPRRKYKPKRALMAAVAFVSSTFLGVFLAFFIEAVEKRRKQ